MGRLGQALALGGLALAGTVAHRARLYELFTEQGTFDTEREWTDVAPSPGADENYPPQGMVVVDDELIVTNHWHGEASALYRVDIDTGEVRDTAKMASEATHTSGLAWDGEWLWAVDHTTSRLYRLDRRATFEAGRAVVEDAYDTGLRGASGLTTLVVDGRRYIAVSDFVWTIETAVPLPLGTGRTFLASLEWVRRGEPVPDAAVCAYHHGGYSQGLTWDGRYLYESLNNLGTDRIEVRDVLPAVRSPAVATVDLVGSFPGPAGRIEDLGTDGQRLWTTDESTYRLYRLDSLAAVRERLSSS
jgi:glutamine cyclotransferase